MSKIDRARVCFGTYYSYLRDSFEKDLNEVNVTIKRFDDNEISVSFNESLRNKHLFIFGETSTNLTELLLTIDAAKHSSVREVTVILPYYGYSRQDKRESSRGCLGASLVAQVIQGLGINRIITIDLHAEQIQGFFRSMPVEHVRGVNLFLNDVDDFYKTVAQKFGFFGLNGVVVSPDAGGTLRASYFANRLNLPLVTINKRRSSPGVVDSMELYGDVSGKDCLIVDDIADSCGTLAKAATLLKLKGANKVIALATHPVLNPKSVNNVNDSKLDGIILSNTLDRAETGFTKPHIFIDCMSILNKAIRTVAQGLSMSRFTNV